jgi:cell division septal protein FtsQ
MAKKKNNNNGWSIFLLVVLPLVAFGLSGLAIYKGVQNYITTSNYFKIRELKVEGINDPKYLSLMKEAVLGDNIFRLDVGRLAQNIRLKFPTFYSVIVTRVLPSQLFIQAKERLPVAVMKRDIYYLFDADGVVISSFPPDAVFSFPLITGLESRLPRLKVGVHYNAHVLDKPLLLARMLRVYADRIEESAPGFKITKIDASDLDQLTFTFGNDLAVKIGDKDFENRIAVLPVILKTIGSELDNVKYIDLRPKEPAVAMKDNKLKKK